MDNVSDTMCVILAGGKGSRMASAARHKACFPIAGRPAIVRAIDTYKAAGLKRFLVVVGQMAEQVIATVCAAHPEVTFVYQTKPRGTGHAASVAIDALAAVDYRGPVMIIMGDKMTRPRVVRSLFDRFAATSADLVVTTLPKSPTSTAGRVVTDARGKALGVVEVPDIERARRTGRKIAVAGRNMSAAQIERASSGVNASLYLFRFEILRDAVGRLRSDNAQGELYLTDTVEDIARRGRVETMLVQDPTDLMAYNTPDELMAIEEVILRREKPPRVSVAPRRKLSPRVLKPAGQWLKLFAGSRPEMQKTMRTLYGRDETLLKDRRKAYVELLRQFIKLHGPKRPAVLCRAPGRINLMGRHVDHRGGYVNVLAISREVLLAAAPREDDLVSLRNMDARHFPPRDFRIFELVRQASWADWLEFLATSAVRSVVQAAPGDWSHYARAPLLRLQHERRDCHLRGMDCLISGDIPMGAGLSSSSALVVAFAEAAVGINALDVTMRDFVDLCGEGEWFVGSRGGSADHAAIRTGRYGSISRIGFFPFRKEGEVSFPADLNVVIANSGAQAIKSVGARDVYNQRVACYEIAQMLLRRNWPAAAGMEHLRDLTSENLKVRSGEIYRALKTLPVLPTRAKLAKMLDGADGERLEKVFATHRDLGPYDLRGVALYGITECVRSNRFAERMAAGDMRMIGRMMRASHDGDRVVRFDAGGKARKHVVRTDDTMLDTLADADVDLCDVSGRYACSTEAIDQLVDLSDSVEGVVGAQLAGAGLGGCMMILVRRDGLDALMGRLTREFYRPRKLPFDAHVCTPVAGAGLIKV